MSSRRAELSIRDYRFSVKRVKLVKSKLLFLKDYLTSTLTLKVPKAIRYLFRFFKRNQVLSHKVTTDRLLKSLVTAGKIHSNCKTFKLSQVRVKYFSEFERIYNPSIINNTAHAIANSAQFARKHLANKFDQKAIKNTHVLQGASK